MVSIIDYSFFLSSILDEISMNAREKMTCNGFKYKVFLHLQRNRDVHDGEKRRHFSYIIGRGHTHCFGVLTTEFIMNQCDEKERK